MKERPILMSGAMVRATLRDLDPKTQTRRVVKLPHNNPLGEWEPTKFGGPEGGRTAAGDIVPEQGAIWHTRTGDCLACPNGQPGDRLWVRETWQHSNYPLGPYEPDCHVFYRADYFDDPHGPDGKKSSEDKYRSWRPSIHMPRSASRITLEVVGVRVERLQDISEQDAIAEGIDGPMCAEAVCRAPSRATLLPAAVHGYAHLWESLNAERGYGWSTNPWVWVISFQRIKQ